MNLQKIASMILNKKRFIWQKNYTNGQYEQSLKCTQRARPCSVKVKSINAMMRKCLIEDIYLYNAFAIFSKLVIEQTANKEIYGESSRLHIPNDVMFHMLLILNYHKLGDTVKSQQSLQDLHTPLPSGKRLDVPTVYRDIYPNFSLRLNSYNCPLTNEMYADIPWNILGICQHICGDYLGALNSYQYSLAVKSFNNFHRTTYLEYYCPFLPFHKTALLIWIVKEMQKSMIYQEFSHSFHILYISYKNLNFRKITVVKIM